MSNDRDGVRRGSKVSDEVIIRVEDVVAFNENVKAEFDAEMGKLKADCAILKWMSALCLIGVMVLLIRM